ncbi:hypothetical protein LTR37_006173 [Vermiconidia calcicola]|uniref:Uncharacterized protein n=1 Tax=Vermiconidia calcicola TaxID=1690605 RepID=A0ACC3NI52_9PEZI|nr:hypothetical protein LTR37_006173 [Vermiconidia calcicola]
MTQDQFPSQQWLNDVQYSVSRKHPQKALVEHFEAFYLDQPSPLHTLLHHGWQSGSNRHGPLDEPYQSSDTYEAARIACIEAVRDISSECRRKQEFSTDADFDICSAFLTGIWPRDCLVKLHPSHPDDLDDDPSSLTQAKRSAKRNQNEERDFSEQDVAEAKRHDQAERNHVDEVDQFDDPDYGKVHTTLPRSAHRVGWLFDEPRFCVGATEVFPPAQEAWNVELNFSYEDVIQGNINNCYFLAAVATLCRHKDHLRKVCVAWDQRCGVYGFVFHRDGRWIYTIIDDYLFLRNPDYAQSPDKQYDPTLQKEAQYKSQYQTGSEALYFSRCRDPNMTWLPLLEKAYAKIHGDYGSTQGGSAGEDLTGGVTTMI